MKKTNKDFNKDTFKGNIGKIDQKMQKDRYAPVYNKKVGIENGKLID
jgi:hypothetical protein